MKIESNFISLELYKKLDAKGFDVEFKGIAPEQWLVIEWFRLTWELMIVAKVNRKTLTYEADCYDLPSNYNDRYTIFYCGNYSTPQQALEVAIDWAVDNHIPF